MPKTPRYYSGPFPTPDPKLLVGAIGWRHTKKHNEDGTRWEPDGFQIVYPDGILTTDMNGIGLVDSTIWSTNI